MAANYTSRQHTVPMMLQKRFADEVIMNKGWTTTVEVMQVPS